MGFAQVVIQQLDVAARYGDPQEGLLVSRIAFELASSERRRDGGLHAVVKQAADSDYPPQHPVEMLPPDEYDGPGDYKRFRDCLERCYTDSWSAPMGADHVH